MSKSSRLISFLLTLILTFSFFCVNSLAAEEENLIDSDLRNWTDANTISSVFNDVDVVVSGAFPGFYALNIYSPFNSAFLYDVSDSVFIDNTYHFSFDLRVQSSQILFNYYNLEVYVAGITGNDISDDNVSPNVHYTIDKSNYQFYIDNGFNFDFKLNSVIGDSAIVLAFIPIAEPPSGNKALCYIGNVSLNRVESNTEGKLDGILGWLQELYNSIVNGFTNLGDSLTNVWERITTKLGDITTTITGSITDSWQRITIKLGDVITNITGSITDSWQRITIKLGEVITNITGSISALGDKLINYILYFQDEPIEENPFIADDDSISYMSEKIQNIVDYINESAFNITSLLDSMSGGVYLFTEFVEDNGWLLALCIFALTLLVFTRFIGL